MQKWNESNTGAHLRQIVNSLLAKNTRWLYGSA
jgi:hypothetical protein